jgi:hypothetical protein
MSIVNHTPEDELEDFFYPPSYDPDQFPNPPETNTLTQLNNLPPTPENISLTNYHAVFALFVAYITKPIQSGRVFTNSNQIKPRVFKEMVQLITEINNFARKMINSYTNRNVYFDPDIYTSNVKFIQSMYQMMVSRIINEFPTFYRKNKTLIDTVNNPINITKGGKQKRAKNRYFKKHTRKQDRSRAHTHKLKHKHKRKKQIGKTRKYTYKYKCKHKSRCKHKHKHTHKTRRIHNKKRI